MSISFDNSAMVDAGNVSSGSLTSFAVAPGASLWVLIGAAEPVVLPVSVLWNTSEPLTLAVNNPNYLGSFWYYLANPTAGTFNVDVTFADTNNFIIGAISLLGTAASPLGATVSGPFIVDSSGSVDLSTFSSIGDSWILTSLSQNSNPPSLMATGPGQTLRDAAIQVSANASAGDSTQVTTTRGTYTSGFSWGFTQNTAITAVEVLPLGAHVSMPTNPLFQTSEIAVGDQIIFEKFSLPITEIDTSFDPSQNANVYTITTSQGVFSATAGELVIHEVPFNSTLKPVWVFQGKNKSQAHLASTNMAVTVTSIVPSTGANNGPVSITSVGGSGFVTGATVTLMMMGQSDIVGTGFTVQDANTIVSGSFDLTGAVTGAWDVTVTNLDTTTGTLAAGFNITLPAPTVSAISPATGTNEQVISITNVTGANFVDGATVLLRKMGHSDIAGSGFTFQDVNTLLGGTFDLNGAAAGTWDVIVTNPDTQFGTLTSGFTVTAVPAPTVSAISPSTHLNDGSVTSVTVTGAFFQTGATVLLRKGGHSDITGSGFTFQDSSHLVGGSFLLTDVALGKWSVIVTNTDSQVGTLVNGFNVGGELFPTDPTYTTSPIAVGDILSFGTFKLPVTSLAAFFDSVVGANTYTITTSQGTFTASAVELVLSEPSQGRKPVYVFQGTETIPDAFNV